MTYSMVYIVSTLSLLAVSTLEDGTQKQFTTLKSGLYTDIMMFLPDAVSRAVNGFHDMLEAESHHSSKTRTRPAHPENSFKFVQTFMGSTVEGKQLSYPSFVQTKVLSIIRNEFTLSNEQMHELMTIMPNILQPTQDAAARADSDTRTHSVLRCPYRTNVACYPRRKYRTYNGLCNNLQKPLWGSSNQPLSRFLEPDYADMIAAPRVSVTGYPLPSARLVSSVIHWDFDLPHHLHTLMLMQVGQFIDHDLSRTAISKMTSSTHGFSKKLEDVECGDDGCDTRGLENYACFPIEFHHNDSDYGHGRKCLMFVRSQEAPNSQCTPGPRQQINQLTSYIDASLIYGSTYKEAVSLRDLKTDRGQLKTTKHPSGNYKAHPPYDRKAKGCRGTNRTVSCFKAGDGRVNEFTGITTQHIVWMREHNRIEQVFHQINPHWKGERLFQETRRLITALWQYTIYYEYLPVILGRQAMDAHGLTVANSGYWNGYDESIDPGIANSFATAAMRFGHTQLQGFIGGRDANYNVISTIPLSTQLRRPQLMYEVPHKGMDMMMLGLIGDSTQQRDQFITKQVSSHLFSEYPPHGLGEDLMSLNMQRGRDHGLPGYNAFREWCGLTRVTTFDQLVSDLPLSVVNRLKILYSHVDDIDLWPAGISEMSHGGAFLGPTFTCILARQFRNLKFGDRFWFEDNVHNPYPFTPAQLAEIRKFRYSKILCENADYLPNIQEYVLLHPMSVVRELSRQQNRHLDIGDLDNFYDSSFGNERVPCSSLYSINLEPWREVLQPPLAPPDLPLHPPEYSPLLPYPPPSPLRESDPLPTPKGQPLKNKIPAAKRKEIQQVLLQQDSDPLSLPKKQPLKSKVSAAKRKEIQQVPLQQESDPLPLPKKQPLKSKISAAKRKDKNETTHLTD